MLSSIAAVKGFKQLRRSIDSRNGIVIKPVGGVGNQLFIYAAGLNLAQSKQVPLIIDVAWFQGQELRSLELDKFQHSGTFVTDTFRASLLNHLPSMQKALRLAGRNRRFFGTYKEVGFTFDEKVLALPPGTHVEGYFQSFKYWESVKHELRNQLSDLVQPTEWFQREMLDAAKRKPWVAVHIRRGDYLAPHAQAFHGVLGMEYYRRALKLMDGLLGRLPLRMFSEDYEAAIKIGQVLQRDYEVVMPPPSSPAIESIHLMAQSSGVICANSSFSWWGAWLGERSERPVVCPRPWFASSAVNDRDLLLQHWLSIGRA